MRGARPRIIKIGTIVETRDEYEFKDWWLNFDPYEDCEDWIDAHYDEDEEGYWLMEDDLPGFYGYSIEELKDMALLAERMPHLFPEEPLGTAWHKVFTDTRPK